MEYEEVMIIVTSTPWQSLKPYTALSMAERAAKKGKKVRLIYLAEGVLCLKQGLGREGNLKMEMETRLKKLMEQGVKVLVCQAPAKHFALLAADLVAGVEFTDDVIGQVLNKDVCVVWL